MATRQIRARTGQLEDPLPEGKKLEEKEYASHALARSKDEQIGGQADFIPLHSIQKLSTSARAGGDHSRYEGSNLTICYRFPKITPVHRDGDDDPKELTKDDVNAHKEELKHMQKKDAKHGGEPNSLSKHGGDVKSMANTMSGRCASLL